MKERDNFAEIEALMENEAALKDQVADAEPKEVKPIEIKTQEIKSQEVEPKEVDSKM